MQFYQKLRIQRLQACTR